jgi:prepilin-type N-terminal cleavage/methylation domain-containing protein
VFYKKNRGFTLVEMLVVIIIIGILAALAVPQFGKTKEHAIGKEAIASLKLIAAAEKIYRMEASVYYPVPPGTKSNISGVDCATDGNINNCLRLSIPAGASRNWDYVVTGAASTFTAYADRVDTAVTPYRDCRYTLAYNDADGEPDPNNTTWCP